MLNPSDPLIPVYERFEVFADTNLKPILQGVQGGFDLYLYARGAMRAFKLNKGRVWGIVKLRIADDLQSAEGELCTYTRGGIPRAMKQKDRALPKVLRDAALDEGEVSPPVLNFKIDGTSVQVNS